MSKAEVQPALNGSLFQVPLTPPHEIDYTESPAKTEFLAPQDSHGNLQASTQSPAAGLQAIQSSANVRDDRKTSTTQNGNSSSEPANSRPSRDQGIEVLLENVDKQDRRLKNARSVSEKVIVRHDRSSAREPIEQVQDTFRNEKKRRVPEEAVEIDSHVRSPNMPMTPLEEDKELTTDYATRRISHDRVRDKRPRDLTISVSSDKNVSDALLSGKRPRTPRALSTPVSMKSPLFGTHDVRKVRTSSRPEQVKPRSTPIEPPLSPPPASIPLPPLSLSMYLQYELSSQRISPLLIHRPAASEIPYESSRVKIERLLNFLLLPLHLEGCLWFGVLTCLDGWLHIFTILPLRMTKSIYILLHSWCTNLWKEICFIFQFIYSGLGRVWRRRREISEAPSPQISRSNSEMQMPREKEAKLGERGEKYHRRIKSLPSSLQPDDKADILKGSLIVVTCLILLEFDASRMYHWVRGQAAIKLYVIYNLLEVCDRLLSALGQDVLECLFSRETLERKPDGHSKVLRPLWLFVVALIYCVVHSTALFYQVVTLNVAVNSYSNALITLLLSNQFVEIKGTVFKKFEKENLFQITCSDIVERFQLWHMLMIIASRNIIETGGFSIGMPNLLNPAATATSSMLVNVTQASPPRMASSILPSSFNIVPSMLKSISAYVPTVSHVLGPFIIVLGSEMFIDWLKHAYIGKFNNMRPIIYARFLDVLAKDYYTNAFGEQNIIKRLGLPVIPLSCLMIRAGFQTYQMFVASWVPASSKKATATLAEIHEQYSAVKPIPSTTVGIIVREMDKLLNRLPANLSSSTTTSYLTTVLVLLLMFLVLLVFKLTLGMTLLIFARARYRSVREREHIGNTSFHVEGGKRIGGWGVIEVDDDKRRRIYEDDPQGHQNLRNREAKDKGKKEVEKDQGYGTEGLEKVMRYDMVAKRIW